MKRIKSCWQRRRSWNIYRLQSCSEEVQEGQATELLRAKYKAMETKLLIKDRKKVVVGTEDSGNC